jgi:hypothetical protein
MAVKAGGGTSGRGQCPQAHAGPAVVTGWFPAVRRAAPPDGSCSCPEVSWFSVPHSPMAPLTGYECPRSLLYRNDLAHRDRTRSRPGGARADGGDH